MTSKKVLFITYNGLLDPLGSSQILPYIRLIVKQPKNNSIHLLSFEKSSSHLMQGHSLRNELAEEGIGWTSLGFTRKLSKLGKAWDLLKMYTAAIRLGWKYKFDIIHCRSLHAAQVGLAVRNLFGGKVIFDMRGLWVDERIDGGIWQLQRILDRLLFRAYKRIERWVMRQADGIVVLTDRVVEEIERIEPKAKGKITVIPCCADYSHFSVPSLENRSQTRVQLEIEVDALVLSYLGSLGTWYRFSDMLTFFREVIRRRGDAFFLIITKDWSKIQENELVEAGFVGELRSKIVVRSATRDEVPVLLGASDVMLSFIEPSYSKLASSPTKLAEAFACGIPVISNPGVGDVARIIQDYDAGDLVELGNLDSMRETADRIVEIISKGGEGLRKRTMSSFDLSRAAASYQSVYEKLS